VPPTNWTKRRNAWSHDWLKNRFLPALAKLVNIMNGRVNDPSFHNRFIKEILPNWKTEIQEARGLIESFEADMSPRSLFSYPPLSRCAEATLTWLPDLVHILWLFRYQGEVLQSDAAAALTAATLRLAELTAVLTDEKKNIEARTGCVVRVHESCEALSDALLKMAKTNVMV
jgi:hypothetical protein